MYARSNSAPFSFLRFAMFSLPPCFRLLLVSLSFGLHLELRHERGRLFVDPTVIGDHLLPERFNVLVLGFLLRQFACVYIDLIRRDDDMRDLRVGGTGLLTDRRRSSECHCRGQNNNCSSHGASPEMLTKWRCVLQAHEHPCNDAIATCAGKREYIGRTSVDFPGERL